MKKQQQTRQRSCRCRQQHHTPTDHFTDTMSAEEDESSSTAAVLMKYDSMEIEDEADALSLRSMPLQKDDDYFYYHGDGGKEDDEDDEAVDHIGLLTGPASAQYPAIIKAEEMMRLSLRSTASEVTIDECDSDLEEKANLGTYTTDEFIDMKLQIADLKAQLDSQLLEHHSTLSSLRDRIMSLENENVDLRQQLKESQDASSRERVEARRVERLLQGMCVHLLAILLIIISRLIDYAPLVYLQIRSKTWQRKCSYVRTGSTMIEL